MYHSFLIHSSADGHLGCIHVLAIINSAAINIGVHVFSYAALADGFFTTSTTQEALIGRVAYSDPPKSKVISDKGRV